MGIRSLPPSSLTTTLLQCSLHLNCFCVFISQFHSLQAAGLRALFSDLLQSTCQSKSVDHQILQHGLLHPIFAKPVYALALANI